MNTNTTAYLERSLVEAIELAKVTGTNAITVLSREVPDITEQLIKFNTLKLSIETAAWFLLSCALLYGGRSIYKHLHDDEYYDKDFAIFMSLLTAVATIVPLVCAIMSGLELLKLIIAPKLWLLEYAAKLLK